MVGRDRRIGGVGDALGEARRKVATLRLAHLLLAPVEDQRLLAQVGGGGQRPYDRFPGEFGIAGDLGVKRPREAGLRHRGAADD